MMGSFTADPYSPAKEKKTDIGLLASSGKK
jgi:hypothetical protein